MESKKYNGWYQYRYQLLLIQEVDFMQNIIATTVKEGPVYFLLPIMIVYYFFTGNVRI
jgi:hypothetical protein